MAWSDDYTCNGWELLPEGVIAADIASETEMPVKPRKWKLPETWKTMILVPDDYTRDVALNELHQRREAFRRQRAAQYEELSQLGETLVQWPEQGFWPRQKVAATFNWLKVLKLLFDKDRKEKRFFLHNKKGSLTPRPVRPPDDIFRAVYGRPSPGLSSKIILAVLKFGGTVDSMDSVFMDSLHAPLGSEQDSMSHCIVRKNCGTSRSSFLIVGQAAT